MRRGNFSFLIQKNDKIESGIHFQSINKVLFEYQGFEMCMVKFYSCCLQILASLQRHTGHEEVWNRFTIFVPTLRRDFFTTKQPFNTNLIFLRSCWVFWALFRSSDNVIILGLSR